MVTVQQKRLMYGRYGSMSYMSSIERQRVAAEQQARRQTEIQRQQIEKQQQVVQPAEKYETKIRYEKTPDVLYLLGHAEPKEKAVLAARLNMSYTQKTIPEGFVGPVFDPFAQAYSRAYESLSQSEKEEYGYRFTDWETIPLKERKDYLGGIKHLQNKKEEVTTQYIEQYGIKDVNPVELAQKYASIGGIYSGKSILSDKFQKELAWEQLTMSEERRKEKYFSKLSLPVRSYSTLFSEVVRGTAGVSYGLPQQLIKLGTGKTVGPDVMGAIDRLKGSPVTGVISPAISEVWFRQDMSYMKSLQKKYPIETFFGTIGEIFGDYLGGKIVGKTFSNIKNISQMAIHKRVPASEIFTESVIKGTGKMDYTKGGPTAMIEKFESVRNPITGKIPVTHASPIAFKTNLRVRPSGFIYGDTTLDKLLLMKHSGISDYITVGGGKNLLETSKMALRREALEEIGIKLTNVKSMFRFPDYPSGNLYRFYKSEFIGTPRLMGETASFNFFSLKDIGSVKAAFHVKQAVTKFNVGDFTSIQQLGKTTVRSYPDVFVTTVGKRTGSVSGGLYVTPYGSLGDWALAIEKVTGSPSKIKWTLFGTNKPSILLSEVDDVVRMPQWARGSVKYGDEFLKYTHEAIPENKIVSYITPKTEAYPLKYHSTETESIIPSGVGMKKAKLGLQEFGLRDKSSKLSDKWYDWWAERTGYREYTIPPNTNKLVPIRGYKPFKISENVVTKDVIDIGRYNELATKSSKGLDNISRGIIEKPILSKTNIYIGATLFKPIYVINSRKKNSKSSKTLSSSSISSSKVLDRKISTSISSDYKSKNDKYLTPFTSQKKRQKKITISSITNIPSSQKTTVYNQQYVPFTKSPTYYTTPYSYVKPVKPFPITPVRIKLFEIFEDKPRKRKGVDVDLSELLKIREVKIPSLF